MMATAAASSVMDVLSKELECSICMDRLKDARCLFCQHTFCVACLESCVQSGREAANVLTCPNCRVVTRLPRGGVASLKPNALINNMLEKIKEFETSTATARDNATTNSTIGYENTVPSPENRCAHCKNALSSEHTFSCEDCNFNFCVDCLACGRIDNHNIIAQIGTSTARPAAPVAERPRQADQFCDKHPQVVAELYCSSCRKVCCRGCRSDGHKRHSVYPVEREAARISQTMETMVDKCNEKNFAVQTTHHEVNTKKEQAVESLTNLMAEVRQKAERVMGGVRRKEEALLRQLGDIKDKVEQQMGDKQQRCLRLEEGLQAAVTNWTALQDQDVSHAASVVRRHADIEKMMTDLLASEVSSDNELTEVLQSTGLQFIPGRFYFEACRGVDFGSLQVKRYWDGEYLLEPDTPVTQLAYMSNGQLIIASLSDGFEIHELNEERSRAVPEWHLSNTAVRDITVLSDNSIVYQDDGVNLLTDLDLDDANPNKSRFLRRFTGRWISVTALTKEGRPLVAVASKDMHSQEVCIMDTKGVIHEVYQLNEPHGFHHLSFDSTASAFYIEYGRKVIHCRNLASDGPDKFQITDQAKMYLALACHESAFLYVAWQWAARPNVISITKHSLDDGRELDVVLSNERVKNSFRMVMANRKDREIAFSTGSDITVLRCGVDARAAPGLSPFL